MIVLLSPIAGSTDHARVLEQHFSQRRRRGRHLARTSTMTRVPSANGIGESSTTAPFRIVPKTDITRLRRFQPRFRPTLIKYNRFARRKCHKRFSAGVASLRSSRAKSRCCWSRYMKTPSPALPARGREPERIYEMCPHRQGGRAGKDLWVRIAQPEGSRSEMATCVAQIG